MDITGVLLLLVLLLNGAECGGKSAPRAAPRPNGEPAQDQDQDDAQDGLKQVHVIFRHGARTPGDTYPNDPYTEATYAPYGPMQLTERGRVESFALGEFLRQRYPRIVGEEYCPNNTRLISTDTNRTKETASYVTKGLWPQQDPNTEVPWDILPRSEMRTDRPDCSEEDIEGAVRESTEPWETYYDLLGGEEVFQYIKDYSGLAFESPLQMIILYSALRAQEDFGLPQPSWTNRVYRHPMVEAATAAFADMTDPAVLRCLTYGFKPEWVLNAARQLERQEAVPSLFALSAHDTTVMSAVSSFRLEPLDQQSNIKATDSDLLPDYSAVVMAEVHRVRRAYGFKFFYRGSTHGPTIQMVPRGCESFCTFDDMTRIVKEAGLIGM